MYTTLSNISLKLKNHYKSAFFYLYFIVGISFLFGCSSSESTPTPVVKKETIKVSFDLNFEGATTTPEPQSFTSGNKATKPSDPERLFYSFNGWFTSKNGGDKVDLDTKQFTSNTVLYAQWKENSHTVTYNLNYPNSTPKTQKNTKNTLVTQPENPIRNRYSFDGWYTMGTNGTKFDFSNTMINEDITLFARWTQIFTITFETYGGTTINPLQVGLGPLTTSVENPTKEHNTFSGWYDQQTAGKKINVENLDITGDKTIHAQWIPIKYTVNFDANYPDPKGRVISPQSVNGGDTAEHPTYTPWRSGFNFLGWYDTPNPSATQSIFPFSTTPIVADKTLYARWTDDFSIVFNTQGGSDVNPQVIKSGGMVSRPSDPNRPHYFFKGWFTSSRGTTPFVFGTVITYKRTIYAHWTRKTLTVSYNLNYPNPIGSSPANQTVNSGETTSQPSPPTREGYSFKGWYETPYTGQSTNSFPFSSTPIKVSKTLYAQWSTDIVVTLDSKGGTDYTPIAISSGARIQKPDTPKRQNYFFEYWYSDEQNKEQAYDFTTPITTSITLHAKWRFRPLTKQALIVEIEKAIMTHGGEVDLNYIDTSYITDMSEVFRDNRTFNGNISQWNVEGVKNMNEMFYRTSVFNQNINTWNVTAVTDMGNMFKFAAKFNQPLNNWDVSNVKDMSGTFFRTTDFNENISNWNVSSVQTMESMFRDTATFNSNISSWNVSSVQTMESMFRDTDVFNGNIGSWNVSAVNNMHYMFYRAKAFNSNINNWNVSSVQTMESMFSGAETFNQELNAWNTSSVKTIHAMFFNATSFNQPLNNWDVSNVTKTSIMFSGAPVFNQPLNNWDVSSVTNMSHMFRNAVKFNQNIDNWNISSVTFTSYMFAGATDFDQPLNSWNTSSVTEIRNMFEKATSFNHDLNNWNTSIVTKMFNVFAGAISFNKPINMWNVSSVTFMNKMFEGATAFNQDLNSWNVSATTNMASMFEGATSFNGNISSWRPIKVTNMQKMFKGATAFNQDLNDWNIEIVTTMESMFEDATNFNGNITNWNPVSVTKMQAMFKNAQAFVQNINSWNVQSSVTKTDAFVGSGLNNNLPSWASP